VLSLLTVLIGIALIVRTLTAGGGALAVGLILGVLFMGVGSSRLYAQRGTR
jgi:hypothetical protein